MLDELSALEAEDLEEAAPVYAPRVTAPVAAPQPGPQYNLPAVPTGPVHMATASAHEEEDEEDRALRELQASMS